jgi:hypothetical protein
MIHPLLRRTPALPMAAALAAGAVLAMPTAHADNKRLNDGVVANVYTVQHQAGCTHDIKISPQLQLAAQWHAQDVLKNRNLDADIGSDGSTVQDRAQAAGFRGKVAETVAINPAVAISGIELINQRFCVAVRTGRSRPTCTCSRSMGSGASGETGLSSFAQARSLASAAGR